MENLNNAIQRNLKTAYQQAIDADSKLDALAQAGQAKFSRIFAEDSPFVSKEKRFMPYVIELNNDYESLKVNTDLDTQRLALLVKKLDSFFNTIKQFNLIAKG